MPIPIDPAQRKATTSSTGKHETPSSHYNNLPFQLGSDISGSQMNMSGIDPPPNSLVSTSMMSSYLGSNLAGNTAHNVVGGANPPPNTPAQVNKLQQIMGRDTSGLGYEAEYGSRQTPISGSMVRRRFIDQGRSSESGFGTMDEDRVEEFNSLSLHSDNPSPSSLENDSSKNKPGKYPDTLFDMDQ
ncbi:hypothetical protein GGI11_003758 [Coemansia sp. RSA 2049]|nr:hypothetical protein GGI11_003758 [Coemansia sp. RSA 2049]KAJ2519865.1 hypothetical protein H4217_002411 [Coemansia sp. RSA 1939]KAJ2612456.1 hypothetical protein EV177_002985 [Coemansia sp. RSA 1804]